MLNFWKNRSYESLKFLVTQIAISIFGLVLSLASQLAKNDALQLCCSIFAILFYLFLIYTSAWDLGSKDHIPVEYGHKPREPLTGLYIGLLANALNLLLALGFSLGSWFQSSEGMAFFGSLCGSIAMFIQGMFAGVLALETGIEGYERLNCLWYMYFLIPLPAVLVSWGGYYMGLRDIKFTKFFDAKPNGDQNKK
ncbi:MAG: hypothetical protein IKY29_02030 [Clostridia bacterium]|nr:hypothetical protein [Clostridia bacterium]